MHFDTAFDMCNFGLRVGESENKSLESTAIFKRCQIPDNLKWGVA